MVSAALHGLPPIQTVHDVARHTGLSVRRVWSLAVGYRESYRTYYLPKKTGGYRQISHPNRTLKGVQRWILRQILTPLHSGECCYGFSRGSKLAEHAKRHIGARAILTVDIENFFPSIGIARVANIFKLSGYASSTSMMLAYLCTHRGSLPQGAPTSPKLANLACHRLDRRLQQLAKNRGFTYTRYADDMTFSGTSAEELSRCRLLIAHVVNDCGFRLNASKTRLSGPSRKLKVTGLVITPESVGIGRQRLRTLRAEIHRLHTGVGESTLAHVQGYLDFVSDVDPGRYRILAEYIIRLSSSSSESVLRSLRLRTPLATTT